MRTVRWMAATVVSVGCLAGMALGQTAAPDREADHQALRQLRGNFMTAISRQDMPTVMTFLAKEFVITSIDQAVVTNREELAAYYDRMFKGKEAPIAKMEVSAEADVLTRFLGENAGYCYGSALATYTLRDGRVLRIKERWTAVLLKEDGEWKVAAAHRGVNFLDNPILSAARMSFWGKLMVFLHLRKPPTD